MNISNIVRRKPQVRDESKNSNDTQISIRLASSFSFDLKKWPIGAALASKTVIIHDITGGEEMEAESSYRKRRCRGGYCLVQPPLSLAFDYDSTVVLLFFPGVGVSIAYYALGKILPRWHIAANNAAGNPFLPLPLCRAQCVHSEACVRRVCAVNEPLELKSTHMARQERTWPAGYDTRSGTTTDSFSEIWPVCALHLIEK